MIRFTNFTSSYNNFILTEITVSGRNSTVFKLPAEPFESIAAYISEKNEIDFDSYNSTIINVAGDDDYFIGTINNDISSGTYWLILIPEMKSTYTPSVSATTPINLGGLCTVFGSEATAETESNADHIDKILYVGNFYDSTSNSSYTMTFDPVLSRQYITYINFACYFGTSGEINPQRVTMPALMPALQELYTEQSTMTILGSSVFENTSMESINIPDSITEISSGAFSKSTGMKEIVIPDSVTTIRAKAFDGCTGLIKLTIGSGVNSIEVGAFHGCDNITTVDIPNNSYYRVVGVTGIQQTSSGVIVFGNKNTIISDCISATAIGEAAFKDSAITSIDTTGTNITTILDEAFSGCTILSSVTIPTVNIIGVNAFSGCTSLTVIKIYAQSIHNMAFYECTGLRRAIFNVSITVFGDKVFGKCTRLSNITADAAGANTGAYRISYNSSTSSDNCIVNMQTSTMVAGCMGTNFSSPGFDITIIGANALYGHTGLTQVVASSSYNKYKTIDDNAFYGCTGLTTVSFPSCIWTANKSAFYGCTSLSSVNFAGCTTLGTSAFGNCTSLESISIPSTLTNINKTAFSGCNNISSITVDSGNSVYTPATPSTYNAVITQSTGEVVVGALDGTVLQNTTSPAYILGEGSYEKRAVNNNLTNTYITPETTKIDKNALNGAALQRTLTIVETTETYNNPILTVKDGAFAGTGISHVETHRLLTGDSAYADAGVGIFKGCTSLSEFKICDTTNGDEYYPGFANVPESTFEDDTALTDITVSSNATVSANQLTWFTSIGKKAFKNTGLYYVLTSGSSSTCFNNNNMFKNIQTIGEEAFYGCNLEYVNITSQYLTSIGANAFGNCPLHYISCPTSNNSPYYAAYTNTDTGYTTCIMCDNYSVNGISGTTIIVGGGEAGVSNAFNPSTQIGPYAFYGRPIQQISLIRTINVGDYAFYNSTPAIRYHVNVSTTSRNGSVIGAHAFENTSITFDWDTTTYTNSPFGDADAVIGEAAFKNCTEITKVWIPEVSTIKKEAFSNCTNMTNLILSLGGSIEDNAFEGCTNLTTITCPGTVGTDSPSNYGGSIFKDCPNITTITQYADANGGTITFDTNTISPQTSGWNVLLIDSGKYLLAGCQNSTIPPCVKIIGGGAFDGCTHLTNEAIIPNSVTTIGANAFRNCTGLDNIIIPEGVTTIGDGAFKGCTGLTVVTIPSTVTSMGKGVFDGCTHLKIINMLNDNNISNDYILASFKNCSSLQSVNSNNLTITNESFKHCSSLETITVNDISGAAVQAFYGCTNLSSIYIKEGFESNIAPQNFLYGCARLSDIYYYGNGCTQVNTGAVSYIGDYVTGNKYIHCQNGVSESTDEFVAAVIAEGYTLVNDLT